MDRKIERAIISGATGAIGVALIQKLISQGAKVLVLCRADSKRSVWIPKHPDISVKYCSLCQFEEASNSIEKDCDYDVFYHFAWEGTFGDSRNDTFLQNMNVKYTLDAVNLAKSFGCHTFIGAGSQAEFGRVEENLTPDTPTFPENGYGIAKLCAGQLSRILCNQLGMRHIWTRILSVYGPMDNEYTLVMSTIIKLFNNEQTHFTKGEQIWDFLYSEDVANAFYLLGEKGINGKTYCIGSGNPVVLKEAILEIIKQISPGANTGIGDLEYPPQQVMCLCADISSLTKDTGFAPLISFEEGISKTVKWYMKNRAM